MDNRPFITDKRILSMGDFLTLTFRPSGAGMKKTPFRMLFHSYCFATYWSFIVYPDSVIHLHSNMVKFQYIYWNHLILSGTKIASKYRYKRSKFYNHLILSGTKMLLIVMAMLCLFYNHLILSGTKIINGSFRSLLSFTIT